MYANARGLNSGDVLYPGSTTPVDSIVMSTRSCDERITLTAPDHIEKSVVYATVKAVHHLR